MTAHVKLVIALFLIAAGFGMGYQVAADRYHAKIDRLEAAWKAKQAEAVNAVTAQCRRNQTITRETSDDYQKTRSDIRRRRAAVTQRLRAVPAVPGEPPAGAGRGPDAAARRGVPGQVVVDADELLDDLATCDEQAARLTGLQSFTRRVREQ